MIKRFAKLTIDIRKAVFLCIAIGLLVSAGILTVFLVSAERSPFLLRCDMKLCECGCGQPTKIITMNSKKNKRIKGEYSRFIIGHSNRKEFFEDFKKTTEYKLCECGCGQEIVIKPHHKYTGIPRFIHCHHSKGKNNPNWQGGKIKRTCEICGNEILVYSSVFKKTCSKNCYLEFQRRSKLGKNNPAFKMEFCSIEGCNNKHYSNGLCAYHKGKKYQQENKDKVAISHRKYCQNHKERVAKQCKEYMQTPAGKAVQRVSNHNHRMLTKDLTKAIIQRVYEDNRKKYGVLTCYLCLKPIINNDDSLDHSTPLKRQGTNDYKNLGIAHRHCNSKKHTMTLTEWREKYV